MEYEFFYSDGSKSRHDTLEGMIEMVIYELEEKDFEREYNSYKKGEWTTKQKIDFITMFDIEVVEV